MGSWFSSPAPPADAGLTPEEWADGFELVRELLHRRTSISIPPELDDIAICNLANWALNRYSSNHPGAAEFHCPYHLAKELELKAACVGFRKDLWYHLNFLARRRVGDVIETQRFFVEIMFEPCSDNLILETCIVLDKQWCNFSSRCAFCPDESKILHPSEFECGKQGHEKEFFRHRCGTDGRTKEFFSHSEMLHTPFMLGATVPRYRLDYVEE